MRTGIAPETCNSSPGNANLRIGTQAGDDEGSHSDLPRKYVLRHTHNITDHTRPCQYGDWRSQAGGFYVLSQSILVRNPYKSQVGNKAEAIHRIHSPPCPLCPLTLVWNAVLRSKGAHIRIKIPAHVAITSTPRRVCTRHRYVLPPASLRTSPLRPPSGVIPAQAGILIRARTAFI